MFQKIETFLAERNVTTHTIVGTFATLVMLYALVPEFHNLVFAIFQATPAWLHKTLTAAFAIYAFYHPSEK